MAYDSTDLQIDNGTLTELALKRESLGLLMAARSVHGHFVAYHEKFGQEDETDPDGTCAQRRAQLFNFPNARAYRYAKGHEGI